MANIFLINIDMSPSLFLGKFVIVYWEYICHYYIALNGVFLVLFGINSHCEVLLVLNLKLLYLMVHILMKLGAHLKKDFEVIRIKKHTHIKI